MTSELKAFQKFMGARSALDGMREQASEYAASWKAFTEQLGKMHVKEDKPDAETKKPESVDKPRAKPARARRKPGRPQRR